MHPQDTGQHVPSLTTTAFPGWFMQEEHWSRAGLPLAAGTLLLAPLVRRGIGWLPVLIYLQLPAYQLHQYEEHAHGAFKREANRLLPSWAGRFTDRNIFWSNVLGVWGVDLAALYLACAIEPAAGLVAPYLAIVNGLLHTAAALRTRRYNPGLWSALLLLLPIGGYSARAIIRQTHPSRRVRNTGLAGAILLHLLVVVPIILGGRRGSGAPRTRGARKE